MVEGLAIIVVANFILFFSVKISAVISIYSNILDYSNDLEILSKYQNKTSCLLTIKSNGKNDIKTKINDILNSDIKYFKIEVKK